MLTHRHLTSILKWASFCRFRGGWTVPDERLVEKIKEEIKEINHLNYLKRKKCLSK